MMDGGFEGRSRRCHVQGRVWTCSKHDEGVGLVIGARLAPGLELKGFQASSCLKRPDAPPRGLELRHCQWAGGHDALEAGTWSRSTSSC